MPSKTFPVFDSDSHVVEPPALWEKYLDPEYRTLGKHALWREEGRTAAYLKVNGEIFRDAGTPTCRAMRCGGRAWAGTTVGALDPHTRHRDDRGSLGAARPPRRYGRDGRRPDAALPDLVRRGLLPGARSGRRLCAGARLQRLDRRFLQGGAGAALRCRDPAAAEHGFRARGAAAGGATAVIPRCLHPADVSSKTAT